MKKQIKLSRIEVIDTAWWFHHNNINPERDKGFVNKLDSRSYNEVVEKYLTIKQELKK
tara:strand:+ start:119 stop:292 length:174 start_codon:yes stop_codon:yes gene_type:complete